MSNAKVTTATVIPTIHPTVGSKARRAAMVAPSTAIAPPKMETAMAAAKVATPVTEATSAIAAG